MSETVIIKLENPDEKLIPKYATDGSAAFDFIANVKDKIILHPHSVTLIPTGLFMEIPVGWQVNITARSGLAGKGIFVAQGWGIIDSDYRGEVKILLHNSTNEIVLLEPYSRIAQGEVNVVNRAKFVVVDSLSKTDRGSGGFGSTGTH